MRKFATALYAAALLVALASPLALAQTTSEDPCKNPTYAYKQCPQALIVRTLYLNNTLSAQYEGAANEVIAALRNILPPESKIYLVPSLNTIVIRALPDDIALAQKLINDLDKPKKTYRLTYTVTEVDGAKKISSQRFAMILTDAQKTSLNQGSRVPMATSSSTPGVQTQFTYMDVGTNFEATLYPTGTGAKLNSKVTQSSFVAATSSDASQQPIVRNLTLEGSSMLTPGKPLTLGSMDVPGSTRHLEVEVVMENLP
jgi:type II secretory pathway component GspD/PulD (secretin)